MEEIVRKTKFLGNYKTIVGDGKTDIVLNTLGKVYILTGNNFKLINKLFEQLDKINLKDVEEIKKSVIISSDLENLKYPGDGILVFNPSNNTLYISYDHRYILLFKLEESIIEDLENSKKPIKDEGFVKKTGDVMTGSLAIYTDKAPLIIASNELIKNLNAEFLGNYSYEEYPKKSFKEYIYNTWIFDKDLQVNNDLNVDGNIYLKGSIGTSMFIPGYLGNGWKMDSTNNMLTVDYLIVRKAMLVYELIINEVSATNGTFWITDTFKVAQVYNLRSFTPITIDEFKQGRNQFDSLESDTWYIPLILNNLGKITILGENMANSLGIFLNSQEFINYGYIVKFKEGFKEFFNQMYIDFSKPNSWNIFIKGFVEIVPFFKEHSLGDIELNSANNIIYKEDTTPKLYSSKGKSEVNTINDILTLYIYYKYFGIKSTDLLYIISCEESKFSAFKEGDLIRCQKYKEGGVKYYDALVVTQLNNYLLLIDIAPSIFDIYIKDNKEVIDTSAYSKGPIKNEETIIRDNVSSYIETHPDIIRSSVEKDDELIRIGSITDITRLGSLYLTSSEFNAPNMKVLDGVNRPDYNVVYYTPKFKKENDKYYTQDSDGKKTYYDIPNKNCVIEENKEGKLICVPNSMVKTLVGKLDGIQDPAFSLKDSPTGYGLYGENVYLTGKFVFGNTGLDVEAYIKGVEGGLEIAIDEVNSGGDNLYNSALDIKTHINGYAENPTNKVLDITSNGFKVIGTKENNTYLRINTVIKDPGYYTISFKALCPNQDHSFKIIGSYMTKLKSNVDNILGEAALKSGVETDYLQYTLYVNREDFLDGIDSLIYFWFPYFNELEVVFKDVKIEKGKHRTAWNPSEFDNLLNTGINIKDKEITVTADKFKVRGNNGEIVANFIADKNGKPVIKAPNLDIDNIKAKDVEISGVIEANKGRIGFMEITLDELIGRDWKNADILDIFKEEIKSLKITPHNINSVQDLFKNIANFNIEGLTVVPNIYTTDMYDYLSKDIIIETRKYPSKILPEKLNKDLLNLHKDIHILLNKNRSSFYKMNPMKFNLTQYATYRDSNGQLVLGYIPLNNLFKKIIIQIFMELTVSAEYYEVPVLNNPDSTIPTSPKYPVLFNIVNDAFSVTDGTLIKTETINLTHVDSNNPKYQRTKKERDYVYNLYTYEIYTKNNYLELHFPKNIGFEKTTSRNWSEIEREQIFDLYLKINSIQISDPITVIGKNGIVSASNFNYILFLSDENTLENTNFTCYIGGYGFKISNYGIFCKRGISSDWEPANI